MSVSQRRFYDRYIDEKVQNAAIIHRGARVMELLDSEMERVLDVGCGYGELLEAVKLARPSVRDAVGMDIASAVTEKLAERGLRGVCGDVSEPWPFADASFDTVICAEVIEHVFDTDLLVREAFRVLESGGSLIVTTPNLAYLANRLLLLAGIQPFWTETSTSTALGRWLPILGQHKRTEGHLRLFTLGALKEILTMHGFRVERALGYRFFQSGPLGMLDRTLTVRAQLSAGLAVRARKP